MKSTNDIFFEGMAKLYNPNICTLIWEEDYWVLLIEYL